MDHVLDAFLVKRRKRRKLITDDLHVLLAFVRQPLGNARFVIRQIGGLGQSSWAMPSASSIRFFARSRYRGTSGSMEASVAPVNPF